MKENILELEGKLSELKKCYDNGEYKGTRNIRNLLDLPIDKDYHKAIITRGPFNSKYIQYKSMGMEEGR